MELSFKNLKGTGWKAKIAKLNTKSNIDLVSLYDLNKERYPFLLESSSRGNSNNRFSILFHNPSILLEKKNEKKLFLENLDSLWKKEKISQKEMNFKKKKIPFCGGLFVYLGYEMASEIEEKLEIPKSPFLLPTAFAARVKSAIIYDHIDHEIILVSEDHSNQENDLLIMQNDLKKTLNMQVKSNLSGKIKILSKVSSTKHQDQVRKCIDYIYQGEIFQANLSRLWKFEISETISELEIYRQLRNKNPAPFAGLMNYKKSSIISSSPERLVSVDGDLLQTRPIAGTRPRGRSGLIDIELSKELINSTKEKAEHLMLLDLERNDISRVCIPGSVKVNEMMIIESYAHVHHIVSNVVGKKIKNITPGKIISAVFPGGTITGCPKVRCMEILGDLEGVGRGPYTGSMGYITHTGDMDFNILIRSILKENNNLFVRAGGGIVADSIPENETFETEAKANGMLKAINTFTK